MGFYASRILLHDIGQFPERSRGIIKQPSGFGKLHLRFEHGSVGLGHIFEQLDSLNQVLGRAGSCDLRLHTAMHEVLLRESHQEIGVESDVVLDVGGCEFGLSDVRVQS